MGKTLQSAAVKDRPVSLNQFFSNTITDFALNGKTARPAEEVKGSSMEQTFTWTANIIKSCNNDFHFDCADVLISLFKTKFGDNDLVLQLKELREDKWVSIHGILV
jgi:hypothetical protein